MANGGRSPCRLRLGQPSRLKDEHRTALTRLIENGPTPAIHGVVRWRLVDLCQWVFEEFRIHVAPQTMSRELHAMDYRKLSARPRHYARRYRRSTLVQSSHGMLSNFWGLP